MRVRYYDLVAPIADVKTTVKQHSEFSAHVTRMRGHFNAWRDAQAKKLKALEPGFQPKELIARLSENLLAHYRGQALTDAYAIYQHLMDYWAETMQDDAWLIARDGWKAEPQRIIETDKKGREKDKGWACDLVPKALVVARYFKEQQTALDALAAELETTEAELAELEEEHGGEDAAFGDFDKINAKTVKEHLDEIAPNDAAPTSSSRRKPGSASSPSFPRKRESSSLSVPTPRSGDPESSSSSPDDADESVILQQWLDLDTRRAELKKRIKQADAALDQAAYAKYAELTEAGIKMLVVDDKWLAALARAIEAETERAGQELTQRVKELAERYAAPLPQLETRVVELQAKVDAHLYKMGFAWK